MEGSAFLLIALFTLAYGAISARLERTVITAPMVFVLFGWLVGGDVLGWVDITIDETLVTTVMELTLVVVLFTDAARIDVGQLRRSFRLPLRVLGSLPLVMILGGVAATLLIPGLSFWEGMVLGVVLAPTDAALGQVVVSSRRVPQTVRQTLNVESGLNDGLALPFLAIALALAGVSEGGGSALSWVRFAVEQVGYGVLIGVASGYLGGRLVTVATRAKWMNESFERLSSVAIAVLAFGLTAAAGGSGFIAAFVAGLTLGATAREVCPTLHRFAEAEGQLLTLVTFLLFGAAAVGPALDVLDWRIAVYILLSLTVVRLLPVALSLAGSRLRAYSVWFVGWFGPRGIASILFGLIVLEEMDVTSSGIIFAIASLTVLASIFAHGLTALPATKHYAEMMTEHRETMGEGDPEMTEFMAVPDVPVKGPMRD